MKTLSRKKLSFSASILLASTLSGCQTIDNMKFDDSYYESNISYMPKMSALEIVSQESQKAVQSQKLLTKYRHSKDNVLDYRQCDFSNQEIMVDYIGKPNELLASIAVDCGYRYLEFGSPQYLPTVNFTQYWTTPFNAVMNVDAQIGNAANIALDESQKVIALFYPSHQPITNSYSNPSTITSAMDPNHTSYGSDADRSLNNFPHSTAVQPPHPYNRNWTQQGTTSIR